MTEVQVEGFLFTPPSTEGDISVGANVAITMGALSSRLVQIERTRTDHPDGRAENVAEHSLMLSKVAPELASQLHPELDANLVASFASLHDDLEAYVGDTPTDTLSTANLDEKESQEGLALEQLSRDFSHMPRYVELIRQYEAQTTPESRFVRGVDKLMVLLIHIPNEGSVLRSHYTKESFLQAERELLERDGHKYGEFDSIRKLRIEIGQYLAEAYLD